MGKSLGKIRMSEKEMSEHFDLREKRGRVVIYGDEKNYKKAEEFFYLLTDSGSIPNYRTVHTLKERSKYEARFGNRIRRMVYGTEMIIISIEVWLLPLHFKTVNKSKYFEFSESDQDIKLLAAFTYCSEDNLKKLDLTKLSIEKPEFTIIDMLQEVQKLTALQTSADIFDSALIKIFKEENEKEEFINSDDEDAENDIFLLKNQKKKVKAYISSMREVDTRLTKCVAGVEDLATLEKNFKSKIGEFLNTDVSNDEKITQKIDDKMATLLKKARYNVNIVDGRGGVRLIPKEDKQEIESPELVELNEQLKIEFKRYNELVYQPINDIMTVYPQALDVLGKLVKELKLDLEESTVIYDKALATGKTERKAFEIYQACNITLKYIENELKHADIVYNYIKKREQRIQVSLLTNQLQ